jgi:hypothetical protein
LFELSLDVRRGDGWKRVEVVGSNNGDLGDSIVGLTWLWADSASVVLNAAELVRCRTCWYSARHNKSVAKHRRTVDISISDASITAGPTSQCVSVEFDANDNRVSTSVLA